MKAITIYQPYASLLACGAKRYETRSWATSYRGPIAIHAAKARAQCDGSSNYKFRLLVNSALQTSIYRQDEAPILTYSRIMDNLDYGAVVATAEIVECHYIAADEFCNTRILWSDGKDTPNDEISILDDEYLFGDWTPGRYAWEFADMKMLDEPIPATGRQRIWEWNLGVGG